MRQLLTVLTILTISTTNIYAQKVYATFDIVANRSAGLAFNSSGIVSSISVEISDRVKRGDTLAILHSDDLQANLNIATVAEAHAQSDYERQQMARDVIQKSVLDRYKFQYDSAKAQVAYLKALLDKTILKAPFDGVISAKKIEEGDVVSGAMVRTVLEIQSQTKRKLILEFDQKYWSIVQIGDSFEYAVDGDKTKRHGVISKIYPKANISSRKMVAEVYAEGLIVGLFGNGYIITKQQDSK